MIFIIQFLSQDIVQALEDPNGTEVLFALLESGANVTLPTKVSSPHIIIVVNNQIYSSTWSDG